MFLLLHCIFFVTSLGLSFLFYLAFPIILGHTLLIFGSLMSFSSSVIIASGNSLVAAREI